MAHRLDEGFIFGELIANILSLFILKVLMATTTLKRRYIAKLSTNLVGLGIALVAQTLIPRGLGPEAYGDFNYLSHFFLQLMPFFTLNTSIGFYTKIAQRQDEKSLISFYFKFTLLACIALLFFVGIACLTDLSDVLWLQQETFYIYMAAGLGILTWIASLLTRVADAYGITVYTEVARIVQKCLGLAVLATLFILGRLNLTTFFIYQYGIFILLLLIFIWIIIREQPSFLQGWQLEPTKIWDYTKEFYTYSHPLFFYGLVGMMVGILDRWLLQRFGGSAQQAFFGLSVQVGALCFLFTSAMTALITREFSISYAKKDLKGMRRLFRRYIPLLFSIAAFFSCFICIQSEKVIYIFAGEKYTGASLPMMIMALYPIHQTYGQLSGSVFYAAEQTKLYRNIGITFMLIGLPIAYLTLAPVNNYGLNAGATGLAIKLVIIQFIAVNVQLYFNALLLRFHFLKYFAHQIICILSFLGLGFISRSAMDLVGTAHSGIIVNFLFSGFLYSLMVGMLVYCIPSIAGLNRDDLTALITVAYKKLKGLFLTRPLKI